MRLRFVEGIEPELGVLGLLDPAAQHVALAVGLDAHGQIDGPDHAVVADLDPQRVEEHHRIHRLERAVLPAQRLGHHFVGDRADEIGRDLSALAFGQKRLNLAHAHAAGVSRAKCARRSR